MMKADRKMVFALIAGAVIGGSLVQALHAEAKPPAYVVGEVDVTNHDAFVKENVPLAIKALSKGGYGYKSHCGWRQDGRDRGRAAQTHCHQRFCEFGRSPSSI
jgi:hypothetical protein